MKLLTYLYDFSELNKMGDIIVVSLNNYSFKMPKMFSCEEIIDIKNKSNKEVYLSLTPLYTDDELDSLVLELDKLKDLDGYIVHDVGLIKILTELGLKDKIIYAPETFITNSIDSLFFDVNKYMISREVDINTIKSMLKNRNNTQYMIKGFGYSLLSYSKRKHISNYLSVNNIDNDFDPYNFTIKEDTRNDYYPIIEDNHGTRIYQNKIFNIINYMNDIEDVSYILLDRIFIEDSMYFDTISLFNNNMDKEEYFNKYQGFTNLYLDKIVGLFKEEKK